MVEGRRKTALQRHAAQAVGLSRGSAGFSFELSAWFCVGAWVRVVGAWTARGRVRDCPSACCSTDAPVDATTAYGRWSRCDARPLYNATRRKPLVLSRGSAGFSFELSAWFCVGAWVRVVGAWTARGRVRDCPSACCSTDAPVDATTAYGRWSRCDARPLYNATRRKPLVLSRGSAGFSFELSAWFCVGAWVRVVGAWTARGRVRDCPSACCSTDAPVDATTAYGRWSRCDARPLYNATRRKPLS